jgi:hypothetical protein
MQGEFFEIQDADDICDPTRIETQLRAILASPELAAVYCSFWLFSNGKCLAPLFTSKGHAECKADIDALRIPAHDATGLYRMSMVGKMRFDPSLPIVYAFDYVLRVGENYPIVVLGDCLYGYRWHPSSITQSDPHRRDRMTAKMLEQACERRGQPYIGTSLDRRRRRFRSRNSLIDNNIVSVFVMSVLSQRQTNRRWGAVRTGYYCALLHPLDPYYYKALIYAVVPARLLHFIRSAKRLKE